MLTYAEQKTIFDGIPTTFSVTGPEGTRNFTGVSKRWANQFADNPIVPAVVLQFTDYSQPSIDPLTQVRNVRTITTDTFTKAVGVDDYLLAISPADEIIKVVGTVAGVKNTIIAPANYTLDTVNNEIDLTGPTKPDDATTFTVEYNHQLYRKFRGAELVDILSVNVFAEDFKDPSDNKFPGPIISEQIARAVFNHFKYDFDEYASNIVAEPLEPINDLDFLVEPPQWRRRRQFEIRFKHLYEQEEQIVTIETVTSTTTVVVFN